MSDETLEELARRLKQLTELAASTDLLTRAEVREELRAAGVESEGLATSILADVKRRTWREVALRRMSTARGRGGRRGQRPPNVGRAEMIARLTALSSQRRVSFLAPEEMTDEDLWVLVQQLEEPGDSDG